jgi:hypothetical protein
MSVLTENICLEKVIVVLIENQKLHLMSCTDLISFRAIVSEHKYDRN